MTHRLIEMFLKQDKLDLPRTAFFTDLDNTLVMKDGSLTEISWQIIQAFEAENVPIIAISGVVFRLPRQTTQLPFLTLEERIQANVIPRFPALFSDVGTRFWMQEGNTYRENLEYEQYLQHSGFSRERVMTEIETSLRTEKWQRLKLRLQPAELLSTGKLSYFFTPQTPTESNELVSFLRHQYPLLKIAAGKDLDDPKGKQHWLDILSVDKQDAIAWCCQTYGLQALIRAGDSPNDESMLFGKTLADFDLSIVVGGAEDSLSQTARQRNRAQLYIEAGEAIGPQSIVIALQQFADQHPALERVSQRLR